MFSISKFLRLKWPYLLYLLFVARVLAYLIPNVSPIFFNDQWDFYPVLAWQDSVSYFELFFQKFGPHRLGVGHVLSVALGRITDFDLRYEAYVGLFIFAFNGYLAFRLKRRLVNENSQWDIFLWVLPLTLAQGEIFVAHINFYMGSVPQLLILLTAHCLVRGLKPWIDILSFGVLTWLSIFSGYAFFVGLVAPVILFVKLFDNESAKNKLRYFGTLIFIFIGLYVFSLNYVFEPAVSCFKFPHPRPWEYVGYVAFMFGRFIFENKKGIPFLFGIASLVSFGFAGFFYLREGIFKKSLGSKHLAPLFLFSFVGLYCGAAAVGRICLGVGQGSSSRYIPYLVPALVALYIYFAQIRKTKFMFAMFAIFLFSEFVWRERDINKTFKMYSEGKRNWLACYKEIESVSECSDRTQFRPHPFIVEDRYVERLRKLKEKNWNLYKK